MNRFITLLLCALLLTVSTQAQKHFSHNYNNVSLADALSMLAKQQSDYTIMFLYNDLEDFRLTTTIHHKTLPDAIEQMIGLYPIRMTIDESNPNGKKIFVECTHKTHHRLTGFIIDEQRLPVAYANVAILNPIDSTLLCGGVTNESGYFAIPCEAPKVIARFSHIGYKTIYKTCNQYELGTIQIRPINYELKGVTIKGSKPTMKIISGGMEIEVQNTLLAAAGSGLDVLSQLPRVSITTSGMIEVFGKGTPQIFINGKQMRNKEELQQMASKDIKSVEVITMPGAKYDAQQGAVIRINTIKQPGDGFSFYGMTRESYFHKFSQAAGASLTYRKRGLEMNIFPYFVNYVTGNDNHFGSTLHLSDHDMQTMQTGLFADCIQTFIPDFKLSYDFNANHAIGASYRFQKTVKYHGTLQSDYMVHHDDALLGMVNQSATYDYNTIHHNANIYYTSIIGKWSLNTDGSFVYSTIDRGQHITETSQELESRTVNTSSTQTSRLYAGKTIATYRLPHGELSFGTELTHSQITADNHNPEGYIKESDNEIMENNYAGFVTYGFRLGNWSMDAGVRYEYVRSDYFNYGKKDNDLSRCYSALFPHLSVNWNKDKWALQLGYTKKTRRPTYGQLRSYQQYDNRFAYEGGNPELQPAIYHAVEGMLNWQWINFSLGYSYQKDYMLWKNDLYGNQEVAYSHWTNIDHKQQIESSLVLHPKFAWYQPQLEIDYAHQFFDAKKYGFISHLRRPAFYFDLKNKFVISKTCWIGLYGRYVPSHDDVQQEVDRYGYVNVRAYKSFFHGALAFNLFFNDLFNTNMEKWTMRTHDVEIIKDCNNYNMTRGISLQITYNLNTTRSKYKGTGAGNDEKNRL